MKIGKVYLNSSFDVHTVIMDGEFEKIKSEVNDTVDVKLTEEDMPVTES